MNKKPRILFYDIETAYSIARIWRTGEQYVGHEQLVADQPAGIICICYKWADEKQIHSLDWGVRKQNNDKMIEEFSKIIESADIAIAHNGDKFDAKHINTQRWLSGKSPISWCQTEDTLKQFRKAFNLPSNKLDYIAQLRLGKKKDPMSFVDWVNVVEGKCPEAMAKMIKYCKKDVQILQDIYNDAVPFFTPRVNRSILVNGHKHGCPSCASENIFKRSIRVTRAGKHQRMQCSTCGHSFKGPNIKLS